MKKKRILIALLCLLLPIVLRTLWFYRGIYLGNHAIQNPDYDTLSITQPTLSTAVPLTYASSQQRRTVLFDQAHGNQFTMTEIETLRNLLLSMDAEIVTMDIGVDLASQLTKADAFVSITPTWAFTQEEIEAVEEFVQRGGRLLVAADPTRSISDYETYMSEGVLRANELLQPFLLSFRNDYAYNLNHNEGNYRNIFVYPSGDAGLTQSVNEVVFYSSHSLDSSSGAILNGEADTHSSLDDNSSQAPVAGLDSSGNVLALGDMTFMISPYDHVSDNYQFILNIAEFLLDGERDRNLFDFPNLFNQSIAIQFTSGLSLDESLVTSISMIKRIYSQDDLPVVIMYQAESGYDRILLGTYPPSDELNEIIADLGISFTGEKPATISQTQTPIGETSEDIEDYDETWFYTNGYTDSFYVPEIGRVPAYGFGYVLLKTEKDSKTLILLGDSQENTAALLQLVVLGTLDDCLVTDSIAVCEQSVIAEYNITDEYYSDYLDSDYDYETFESETSEESELPLEPTATASG